MLEKEKKIRAISESFDPASVTTIADLQDKEFSGESLTEEQEKALRSFRKLRVKKLAKKQHQEEAFHARFEYLRALSNLVDYRQFIGDK
ncbi:MAG: hypothetical protein RIC95_01030 [Vicingaceae bacterium]